jgi:hypothetical protein
LTVDLLNSYEELMLNPKMMFANKVLTDGSSVSVVFSRKAKPNEQKVQLELTDFTLEEVGELFNPCAIDPGRTNAYTAAYGFGNKSHMVVRYTTKEYYNSPKTSAEKSFLQMKQQAGIMEVEEAMPTAKTCDERKYYEYVHYVLAHVPELYQFYGSEDGKLRWFKYKNKQKAISEAVNILANGGKKYRRKKNGNTKRTRRQKRKKKERLNEFIK